MSKREGQGPGKSKGDMNGEAKGKGLGIRDGAVKGKLPPRSYSVVRVSV